MKDLGVRLDEVEFKTLTLRDNEGLVAGFTEKEVKDAVWQCEGSKSPGPDGFNFNFIRKSWDFVKAELMEAMALFHATGNIPKGCNASFIALIPKVRDPTKLEQYRPISLVGVFYKIITKVLAGRLKKVLPAIIDESQSSFLKGRGILDSVLMANEVVEDLRKKGRSGISLKVDFEKAYDSVRWDFLYDMLHKLGFHSVWILWIRGCLESATVSVLVNGSPTEEFKPSRGLRQGDPLAPFLFIVVAEGLAGLVRQALKVNLLTGLKIGRHEVEMSILQFADDTLFLCEDTLGNVLTLKAILRGFELASGLKINFHKSKLAGINVQSGSIGCYTKTLNCKQMEVPFNYLGLEVGGNPRRKQFWDPVINKLKAKLSVWKGRFLSMAGRICLINSVLTAIPLYYISLFKVPTSVCKRIISIQTRFLWGWGKVSKPIAWVSWKDVCRPKEEGGLGCRDILLFNKALLAKWRWRCLSEENGRWKKLLDSKYELAMESSPTPVKYQSCWWRDLSKLCKEGGGQGWFKEELSWKIGRGDKAKFWEDFWIGSVDLRSLFPRLYSLSVNQGNTVGQMGEWDGKKWKWDLRWRRGRFEWESSLERDLDMLLSGATLRENVQDTQLWGKEVPGLFSVSSAYDCLAKHGRGNQGDVYKLLWRAKAFPNALVTAWRVLMGRLPTRVCLSRRGVVVISKMCPLCQLQEETCQHLFMECSYAQKVWSLCMQWVDTSSAQQQNLKLHFQSFHLFQVGNKQNRIWKGVWVNIIRCLWDQRNLIIFQQGVVDAEEVFQRVQLKSWLWMKHKVRSFYYSFVDWVLNPIICLRSC